MLYFLHKVVRRNKFRCKDTEVEWNGKTCFDISEMKYLRERSESKIRKLHKPSKESMILFRRFAGHYHIIGDEVTLLLLGSGMS